ncbi:MAG: hypothetical protein HGA45_30760 [Chloroflexales bacterium]|nr:hypothetical protein [Chloroflexales bacterium]
MSFLNPLRACGFAVGATCYRDQLVGSTHHAQLVVPVRLGGWLTTEVVVDTGSTWCILSPELVTLLEVTVEETYAPSEKIVIRGVPYNGRLVRLAMRLPAAAGEDLEVDGTAFVPILPPGAPWAVPNFIGLECGDWGQR